MNKKRRDAYWRENITLISILLLIWASVSLGCSILLVKFLNNITIGNLPFGFWMAQQGSIFIFVILIFVYAVQMEKIERKYEKYSQSSIEEE